MRRPDKAARAAIARRRSGAIDLRLAGVDWLTIARKLAADPTVNSDGIAYPQGYGVERYRKNQDPPTSEALIHAACRDVRTALADRRAELNDDVDELRALEADRLDRLFFVAYKKAVRDQDLAAIDRTLRIMERRARLLGLDMPVRTELSGLDGRTGLGRARETTSQASRCSSSCRRSTVCRRRRQGKNRPLDWPIRTRINTSRSPFQK